MAPREAPKATPKVHRSATKTTASKDRSSPATAIKKKIVTKKPIDSIPLKMNNKVVETKRQRTSTAPAMATPKPKEKKPVPLPTGITKSAKKPLWKRRPLPAHSGVPVPEKMKQLFKKQLKDLNDSL